MIWLAIGIILGTFGLIGIVLAQGGVDALHAFVYGRWSVEYLGWLRNRVFPRANERRKTWWSDRFHGKVILTEEAKAIISIDREIRRDLEQIIPYPMARDLVLKHPLDVVVTDCSCRRNMENPCQPLQVCMLIGKRQGDFILQHHPERSRRLSKDEALALLQEQHELGHIQTAWFKDAMKGRFYAICNCCTCCCFGLEAMEKYGIPMVAPSGYIPRVDETLCAACATCAEVCPFKAIHVNGTSVVDWESCMGCGICVSQCPNGALSLVRDEKKGIPLDVRLMD